MTNQSTSNKNARTRKAIRVAPAAGLSVDQIMAAAETPLASFDDYDGDPFKIVALFQKCGGDVFAYCHMFTGIKEGDANHDKNIQILARTFQTLHRTGNEEHKVKWDDALAAYKHAKVALAEMKGLEFISKWNPPALTGRTGVKISDYVQYARFWLAAHYAAEGVKGKKEGQTDTTPSSGKPTSGMADIVNRLREPLKESTQTEPD